MLAGAAEDLGLSLTVYDTDNENRTLATLMKEHCRFLDEQNKYLNMCAIVMTELSPRALLGACLGIEAAMMRERTVKNASRLIDIDLLLYEDEECYSDELTLPHPEIKNRAFVMVPLAEIFPDKKALGYDFASAYQRVDKSGVERLG